MSHLINNLLYIDHILSKYVIIFAYFHTLFFILSESLTHELLNNEIYFPVFNFQYPVNKFISLHVLTGLVLILLPTEYQIRQL